MLLSISSVRKICWLQWCKPLVEFGEHPKKCWGAQWWKSRRLVCTRVMPCSLQASITTWSAAEPAGAAMNPTPLYTDREVTLVKLYFQSWKCSHKVRLKQVSAGHSHAIQLMPMWKMLYLPVWHDLCCLWRGRRRQSWQPQPAGSWSSSSSQPLTEAQAPLQTSTSKRPSLGPVNTQYGTFQLLSMSQTLHVDCVCLTATVEAV